jgi:hypothetical protein
MATSRYEGSKLIEASTPPIAASMECAPCPKRGTR